MELTYLFTAHFLDGSIIAQTPEDRSSIDSSKSAYYDVQQRDDLVAFALHGHDDYYVDLVTGEFTVNFAKFQVQPTSFPYDIPQGGSYKLIYFRDHKHELSGTSHTHTMAYRIGWEYRVNGKSWVQTLVVK